MRSLMLSVLLFMSCPAFAEFPIVGSWYTPYTDLGNSNYNPESLVQIDANGIMTTARIFPGNTQKIVSKDQLELTETTLRFVKPLESMTCPHLTDKGTPTDAVISYVVENNSLVFSFQGKVIAKTVRATREQIRRFENAVAGCD